MKTNKIKTFLIINLGYLGDIILNSALIQNLKLNFPDSKIIFIAPKTFIEAAQGLPGVDKTYYFDKKGEHKSLKGFFIFLKEFKEKFSIDTAFITHPQERSTLLSVFLGSKRIVSVVKKKFNPFNIFITDKICLPQEKIDKIHKINFNNSYLEIIGLKAPIENISFNYPEKYNDIISEKLSAAGLNIENFITLNPVSKSTLKDWNYKRCAEIIQKLNTVNIKTVLIGTQQTKLFGEKIKEITDDFIDMTNNTTIFELSALLNKAKVNISVDTGTMHLSYAIGKSTICLFFRDTYKSWTPKDTEKNPVFIGEQYADKQGNIITKKEILPQNIYEKIMEIIPKCKM